MVLRVCIVILALSMTSALVFFRVYGTDTRHASRGRIWWPERCRSLTPPTATDITLRRDPLGHHAIYTVTENDLNDFLDDRFARPGQALDSFRERSLVKPGMIGKEIGPLGWKETKDTVMYSYTASNGGVHEFHHDSKTGLTYQSSAYW